MWNEDFIFFAARLRRDPLGSPTASWCYLIYPVAVVVLVVLAVVLRAQLNVWGGRPVAYANLELDEVLPYVRSWGPWLDDRGRIVIHHAGTDVEVELRKHRFATKPDALLLRVRNADGTKSHFDAIKNALESASVTYELETTPKTRKPRAIGVRLVAEDVHTPAATRKLLDQIFGAVSVRGPGFVVYAEGSMRRAPDAPNLALIPWRQDHRAGFVIGERFGRAVKRIFG